MLLRAKKPARRSGLRRSSPCAVSRARPPGKPGDLRGGGGGTVTAWSVRGPPTAKDRGYGDAGRKDGSLTAPSAAGRAPGASCEPRRERHVLNPQTRRRRRRCRRSRRSSRATRSRPPPAPTGPTKTTGDVAPSADRSPVGSRPNPEPVADAWGTLSADVQDEYDPLRPNSYRTRFAPAGRRRAEEEAEAREAGLILEGQRGARGVSFDGVARPRMERAERLGRGGVSQTRPLGDSKTEASTSGATAAGDGERTGTGTGRPGRPLRGRSRSETVPAASHPAAGPGMSAAQRMMMKMGWKEGQGLGKSDRE